MSLGQGSILDSGADMALKSPLRYPGGKNRVARMLLEYAPEHREYREIFAGGASMFFHKPLAARNWLNDLHPGLYAFYVTLRDNFDAFAEKCREQTGDLRERFNYWAERRDLMDAPRDEDLLERAVQYYFLNRTVWTGRVMFDPKRKSRLYFSNPQGWDHLEKKLEHLRLISRKLAGVKITCLGFEKCVARASEHTFIYADPPYIRDTDCHPTDKLYEKSFDLDSHKLLAQLLDATPAKVMISYDDCEEARELYRDRRWHLIELQWKYCGRYAMTKEAKQQKVKEKKVDGRELLIVNYEARGA
jgi:DNA adenine methylase